MKIFSFTKSPKQNIFKWLSCCCSARLVYVTAKSQLCVVRQNGEGLCRVDFSGAVRMWEYLHTAEKLTGTVAVSAEQLGRNLSSGHPLWKVMTKTDTVVCRQWNVKYCLELSNCMLTDLFCLLVCKGVRLGCSHWGRNIGWGCLRIEGWREY